MNRKKSLSFIVLLFALTLLSGAESPKTSDLLLKLDFTSGESQLLEVGATYDTSIDLSTNVNKASSFSLLDKIDENDEADFMFEGSINIYWKINTGITPIEITIGAKPFKNENDEALPWTISFDKTEVLSNSKDALSKTTEINKFIDAGFSTMKVIVDAKAEGENNFVNMPSVPTTTFILNIGVKQ